MVRLACKFAPFTILMSLLPLVGLGWHRETLAAQLTLKWVDNSSNEDGFSIQRMTGTSGTFAQIATVGPNTVSYVDTALLNGTTYCYQVQAFNSAGASAPSNQACATSSTYYLTVTKTGTGAGTVGGSGINCGTTCSASLPSGTPVTLAATPATGSTFAGWSGGGCSGTGSCMLTLSANTTVTATFNLLPTYTLAVTKTGTGTGTVSGSGINCGTICSASLPSGTPVTLAATPATGSTFAGWSGGGCFGNGTCTLTLSATTTVTAAFNQQGVQSANKIVTGAGPRDYPWVRGFTDAGSPTGTAFLAYDAGFTGGVFVAIGDLAGLAQGAIVTGSGPGGAAAVRIFRPDNSDTGVSFLPYASSFTGGVRVAVCDLDGEGRAIVTAPGPGYAPRVTIWNLSGTTVTRRVSFLVTSKWFTGGVFVACGDVNHDGRDEIVTGLDAGGPPQVSVYSLSRNKVAPLAQFNAYDPAFTGGVRVAVADVNSDGQAEIITGPGPGAAPEVRIFSVNGSTAREMTSFLAYEPSFTGGVFVAGGNPDAAGHAQVATVPGRGGAPYVQVFTVSDTWVVSELGAFFVDDPASPGGCTIATPR